MRMTMNTRVTIAFLLIAVSLLFSASCMKSIPAVNSVPAGPDATLTKVAIYINDGAKAVGTLQASVIQSNAASLISNQNTAAVLNVCSKVNTFLSQASAITRGQAQLAPAQRSNLLGLLNPIISAFQADMNAGLVGINDANTRATVSAGLLAVQTAIVGIQAVLGNTATATTTPAATTTTQGGK